jgi:CDP-glucose 4,6-dehydratase
MNRFPITPEFWSTQRVLLTGHTGFKGSWLTLWLHRLGATVRGISLAEPSSQPSMFTHLDLAAVCDHRACDIRDGEGLTPLIRDFAPTIVIHMAAQALVRKSYREPVATFATNAMGTANVLEACRGIASLRSVVIVTTDKCYENREWVYPYREVDPLGGHDPYSASKAAAEIVTGSYRRSYFHEGAAAIASARAGNVIGGGDWSEDRLIVDAARAFGAGKPMTVRNIAAVRPWQHVLEPLSGYLTLARALVERGRNLSPAFNFGPPTEQVLSVGTMVDAFTKAWGQGATWKHDPPAVAPHEAGLLMLDPSLAQHELGWLPRWRSQETIAATVEWYKAFYAGGSGEALRALSLGQIGRYCGEEVPKFRSS